MKRAYLLCILLTATLASAQFTVPQRRGVASGSSSPVAATPVWSPNPAYFISGGSVSMSVSCSTTGAYNCYTTGATTPVPNGSGGCSTGTLYSSAVAVSVAETLNAVCDAPGYTAGAMASVTTSQTSSVLQINMTNGSGTTATDSSVTANSATITVGSGGWTTLSGVSGGVYNFDGSATVMKLANNTYSNFNYNQAFSIFAVVSFTGTSNYETIISTLDTANNYKGYEFTIAYTPSIYWTQFFLVDNFGGGNAIQVGTESTLTPGTLYDLLVTYDGSHTAAGVTIYVNGSSQTIETLLDGLTTTTTNTKIPWIGQRQDGSTPFKNKMGPIRMWNRVLTSTEASTLHSNFYATIN